MYLFSVLQKGLNFLLYSDYVQHIIFNAILYIHEAELWKKNLYIDEILLRKKKNPKQIYTVAMKYTDLCIHDTGILRFIFC